MALKNRIAHILVSAGILLGLLAGSFVHASPAQAMGSADANSLPIFSDFSISVQNGDAKALRGVYVPNVLALSIVQQPSNNPGFLSQKTDDVTQFRLAQKYGTVGLVAHNYLAGKYFLNLQENDEVRLIYGDGHVDTFVVTEVLQYQALQPNSIYSSFRDVNTNETLTVGKMFKRVFVSNGHVTFQTCLENNGLSTWGRLFVIAIPKAEYDALQALTLH